MLFNAGSGAVGKGGLGQRNRGKSNRNSSKGFEALNLEASNIRFSQRSVNGSLEIIESMRKNGWQGDAIDVVRMPDGGLAAIDNTRVAAARIVGIDVKANIREYNEELSKEMLDRFKTNRGKATTWGEAVELRIRKQNAGFRNNYPMGSDEIPNMKGGN